MLDFVLYFIQKLEWSPMSSTASKLHAPKMSAAALHIVNPPETFIVLNRCSLFLTGGN